jgi:hypothetical protein
MYAASGARDVLTKKDFLSKLYYRVCCFVVFSVAAAASFNGYYDKYRLYDTDPNGSTQGTNLFEPMVDGSAERPYVYRQLLPMLANCVDRLVPEPTKDHLFARESHGTLFRRYLVSSPIVENRAYFLRYLIVYFMTFQFAWISVFAMFQLCKSAGYARGFFRSRHDSPHALFLDRGRVLLRLSGVGVSCDTGVDGDRIRLVVDDPRSGVGYVEQGIPLIVHSNALSSSAPA